MILSSRGYEPVIYINAEANRASGGIVLSEAKREFQGFKVLLKQSLPLDVIVTGAIWRTDKPVGDPLEYRAPVRMSRYLEDRLLSRLERLRVSN